MNRWPKHTLIRCHTLCNASLQRFSNNTPANPKLLWETFKEFLADDYSANTQYIVDQIYHHALHDIDTFLQSLSRSIDEFGLVEFIVSASKEERHSREFEEELNYNISELDLSCIQKLNCRQREAFNAIMELINQKKIIAVFADGPDGFGKTFLYQALMSTVRSKKRIALAVASSRAVASLIPGGRTTHLRFKLMIIMDDYSCAISK